LEAIEVLEAEELLADRRAEGGIALFEASEKVLGGLLVEMVEEIGHGADTAAGVKSRAALDIEVAAEIADDFSTRSSEVDSMVPRRSSTSSRRSGLRSANTSEAWSSPNRNGGTRWSGAAPVSRG